LVEFGGDLFLRRSMLRTLWKIHLETFGIGLTAGAVPVDKGTLDALACGSVPLRR
jgi:hypothetical protein